MKTRVITICNQKGGVGKTSTVINLGFGLAFLKKKVLFIDLDKQCDLTDHLNFDTSSEGLKNKNMFQLLINDDATAKEMIVSKNGISAILSTSNIQKAAKVIADDINYYSILRKKLEPIIEENLFDYILIDTPPNMDVLTINGIYAADEIIVPMQVEMYALKDTYSFVNDYADINQKAVKNGRNSIKFGGILLTMCDRSKLTKSITEAMDNFKKAGYNCFNTVIRRNKKISETPNKNQSIFEYAPKSIGSEDYSNFVKEIIAMEEAV